MLWLSLLVLMLLIAAAPGIWIYIEYRNNTGNSPAKPGTSNSGEAVPKR
jgi:hypothetical protein